MLPGPQISAKFLKDGVPVIDIYLAIIMNLMTKLDAFSPKCKTAKMKPLFKK